MKTQRPYPALTITPKGERALVDGHPWVYAGEVTQVPEDTEDGALVDVLSRKGSYLGTGFYNSRSMIRVRLLSRNANDRFDRAFWARREVHPPRQMRAVSAAGKRGSQYG